MRALLRDGRTRAAVTLAFEHPDMPGEIARVRGDVHRRCATPTAAWWASAPSCWTSPPASGPRPSARRSAPRRSGSAAALCCGPRSARRSRAPAGRRQRMQRLAELLVPRFADTAHGRDRRAARPARDRAGGIGRPAAEAESLVVPPRRAGPHAGHAHRRPAAPSAASFDADERLYARDVADRSALSIDNERLYEREQETAADPAAQPARGGAAHGRAASTVAVNYRPTPGRARAGRRRLVRRRDRDPTASSS